MNSWCENAGFKKGAAIVKSMIVVNDPAERAVQLGSKLVEATMLFVILNYFKI